MFSLVDIGNFGSFTDFTWKKSLKDAGNNVQNFKRLNIGAFRFTCLRCEHPFHQLG
jgi:hypothetical protein